MFVNESGKLFIIPALGKLCYRIQIPAKPSIEQRTMTQ